MVVKSEPHFWQFPFVNKPFACSCQLWMPTIQLFEKSVTYSSFPDVLPHNISKWQFKWLVDITCLTSVNTIYEFTLFNFIFRQCFFIDASRLLLEILTNFHISHNFIDLLSVYFLVDSRNFMSFRFVFTLVPITRELQNHKENIFFHINHVFFFPVCPIFNSFRSSSHEISFGMGLTSKHRITKKIRISQLSHSDLVDCHHKIRPGLLIPNHKENKCSLK